MTTEDFKIIADHLQTVAKEHASKIGIPRLSLQTGKLVRLGYTLVKIEVLSNGIPIADIVASIHPRTFHFENSVITISDPGSLDAIGELIQKWLDRAISRSDY
jgi:hypothetical protein